MSKVFIEETTLTSIGNAIRAKTGKSELIAPLNMATEIGSIEAGGGDDYFTDENLVFTGDCTSLFAYDKWKEVLEREKDRVKIVTPTHLADLLMGATGEDYSFLTITCNGTTTISANGRMFYNCSNIKKLPVITNALFQTNNSSYWFYGCENLTDTNEIIKFFQGIKMNDTYMQSNNNFYGCKRLRTISEVFPYIKTAYENYTSNRFNYGYMFNNCYSLDEIVNIPIIAPNANCTSNALSGMFSSCYRVKDITFETNSDGTPQTVNWKSQTIDLTSYVGYAQSETVFLQNTDFTIADKADISDLQSFTAFIEANPNDWWTDALGWSRYDKQSAIRTINSLPDTSAYLASAGGTNTIKFKNNQGSSRGESISKMTAEEIAVATAKGWTVTFV